MFSPAGPGAHAGGFSDKDRDPIPQRSAAELWVELGANMRSVRQGAEMSLRQVERVTQWGRGTLSQVENGKSHPTRAQVEWYDTSLGGCGLLVSMYAEARGAHRGDIRPPGLAAMSVVRPGDAFAIVRTFRPVGDAVPAGVEITAGWTLRNTGAVAWRDRRVTRVGTHNALRLLASRPWIPLRDCEPGEEIGVTVQVSVPTLPGTLAAYWHITDPHGRPCFSAPSLLPVIVSAI